ncbi:hypothetical protein AMATHDRAFT_60453 [Amanita thiersii Skay4041]|uniref:Tethering factor for nuclear proteasome STS1 n=1 Tax=Amanita thiersii Skay4041 TaxID=703135 RepID=A0A2A9NSW6_9AGAR|nr:hypothetical protein AMATHDRAFT_60453 [Amanita thiersii Skay4041]
MANVLHHHIEFHPRQVSHAPSPFGFGFGLGTSAASAMASVGWQPGSTPGHTNPAAFHQLASAVSQSSRVQKRRLEQDDESESHRYPGPRDESMDRSPTPERPKPSAPKRARIAPASSASKDGHESKENKTSSNDDGIDIGVVLASLPPQSLLPLLNALLHAHPSLKSSVLHLIPRPTLEVAIQALAQAARKLRDAYPYSNVSSPSHTGSGMRDSYVLSRLRPPISEFVSTCFSYFPYFSYMTSSLHSTQPPSSTGSQSPLTILQILHKDKLHPSETFLFLSTLTNHIISQPPLAQTLLMEMLFPRLMEEWNAWADKIDQVVNRQGGIYGSEAAQSWERGLTALAEVKGFEGSTMLRELRDKWVAKAGWMIGRMAMD